jgi:hypothetical protein
MQALGNKKNRRRFKNILPVFCLFLAGLWLLLELLGQTTAQAQPPSGLLKTFFPLIFRSGPLSWPTISLNQVVGTWFSNLLKTAPFGISTFGEDQAGSLYAADYAGGSIHQITSP